MKKVLSMFLSLVIALGVCLSAPFAIKSKAATVNDLTFELNDDGQSYCVSDCYTSASGELVIPNTYNDLLVTSIGDKAFENCNSLTSVTIPESITYIGGGAFTGCTGLQAVYISDIKQWLDFDFTIDREYDNYGTYITTSNPLYYAKKLYLNGELLSELVIPDGFKSIGANCFYNCTSIQSVTIPDSVVSVGENAFYGCTNLNSIKISDNTTNIHHNAFENTGYYNDIANWENDVLYIGRNLIKAKSTLSGEYKIKEGTKSIAESAFCNVSSEFYLGSYYDVCYGCTSLTSITIPSSVTSIGKNAFSECTGLQKVFIDDLSQWFKFDFSENKVTKLTSPDPTFGADQYYYFVSNPLYYADELYLDGELLTELIVPADITEIKHYTFNFTSFNSVTIHENVTSISDTSFSAENKEYIIVYGTYPYEYVKAKGYQYTDATSTVFVGDMVFELNEDEKSYCIVDCNVGCSKNLVIPTEYNDKPVTKIGASAFSSCSSLSKVTIPDSVISIGDSAFSGCSSLTEVTIPGNVTSIENSTFSGCSSLTEVTIPGNVTNIGNSVFSSCSSLSNVTIPDSVISIGNSAFSGCSSLTEVTIPGNVTNIGNSVFSGCSSLSNVTIPDSVISIGNSAFSGCSSLTEVTIPNNITSIENSVFSGCSSLSKVTIPDSVISIGNSAFSGCSSLTEVTIPDCVSSIGNNAFYNTAYYNDDNNWVNNVLYIDNYLIKAKTSLSGEYIIEEGITLIADSAFINCKSLTLVKIPESVINIGEAAFNGCTKLYLSVVGGSHAYDYVKENDYNAAVLGVNSIDELQFTLNTDGESYECNGFTGLVFTELVIPGTYKDKPVVSISSSAFSDCTPLTSVSILGGIETIGNNAFKNCTSLESVTIEYGVTNIGNAAFAGCSSLKNVKLPDSIIRIQSEVFSRCTSLENIIIPDGVTSIGFSAFSGCTSLISVTIPSSVTAIERGAFSNCYLMDSVFVTDIAKWCEIDFAEIYTERDYYTGVDTTYVSNPLYYAENLYLNGDLVTDIIIPDGVTEIKNYAFYNCTSIVSVSIPESVTSIGKDAFSGCEQLIKVYVTDIGKWCMIDFATASSNPLHSKGGAMYLNDNIVRNLVIPDTVKEIKPYTFYRNRFLKSVKFPDTVTVIQKQSFYYCSSLELLDLSNNLTTIGDRAFRGCSLLSVALPKSLTAIGDEVFNTGDHPSVTMLKYVFYNGSFDEWKEIKIGEYNKFNEIKGAFVHYNTTDHTYIEIVNEPVFDGVSSTREEICSVCGFVGKVEEIEFINEYLAGVTTFDVALDEPTKYLSTNISASQDISESFAVADGYTLTTTPTSSYGFIGTGSKLQVADSTGTQVAEYTLVVRGDVNGDSVCDVIDCMLLELAKNNNTELDGAYLAAGDLAENGDIDVDDFEAVVNKALI